MDQTDDSTVTQRSTAPQSPYTVRQVAIGFLIFASSLVVLFGLALLV